MFEEYLLSPTNTLKCPSSLAACHSDDVALHLVEAVFRGEGLRHGSVDDLLLVVAQRIGLEGVRLQETDLGFLYLAVLLVPVEARRCSLLTDIVTRQADDDLLHLYPEILLCFGNRLPQLRLDLAGVENVAVPDAVGRAFLVVDHLHVLVLDPCHADRNLRGAEICRCYVPFFHIREFIFCRLSVPCISRPRSGRSPSHGPERLPYSIPGCGGTCPPAGPVPRG